MWSFYFGEAMSAEFKSDKTVNEKYGTDQRGRENLSLKWESGTLKYLFCRFWSC